MMKQQVEKIFDDLDRYLDFCRIELREFNPTHLYDKENENYRSFLNSQRPQRRWDNNRGYKPQHRRNEQNFSR
jgi:hypothetical protein